MGRVGRLGRVLGALVSCRTRVAAPSLPPEDLGRVINEVRGGRLDYRNDRQGNLHMAIGKTSFDEEQIKQNLLSVVDSVNRAKPTGAKGTYIKTIALTSTMGPSVRLDPSVAVAESVGASS